MDKQQADRALWGSARTVADLGTVMARWLEGDIHFRPAYLCDDGPEEETAELVPVLAAANRAGYLTDNSQPGYDGPGHDGRRWQQRAAVTGFITDHTLLNRVLKRTKRAGLWTIVHGSGRRTARAGVTVTWGGGHPYAAFGHYTGPQDLKHAWQGISQDALTDLLHATQVTLIDPTRGPGTRLWDALADITERETRTGSNA